jgi:hypothetical protein
MNMLTDAENNQTRLNTIFSLDYQSLNSDRIV